MKHFEAKLENDLSVVESEKESSSSTSEIVTKELEKSSNEEPKDEPSKIAIKHLSTFKKAPSIGSINNSKTNKLITSLKDKNSLESINSKFSVSSTNDDSLTSQNINNNNNSNIKDNETKNLHRSNTSIDNQQTSLPKTTVTNRPYSSNSASSSSSSNSSSSANNSNKSHRKYVSPPSLVGNLKTWQDVSDRHEGKKPQNKTTNIGQVAMICLNNQPIDQADYQSSLVGEKRKLENEIANIDGNDFRKVPSRKSVVPYRNNSRASSRVSIVVPTVEISDGPPFMFAGIVASIIGSFFFSFGTVSVKLLPNPDSISEKAKALFFRGIFITMFCTIANCCKGVNFKVPKDEIWINAARAFFGTLGVFGSYCALTYISAGDSTAIMFSSPIWTSILSHFIFKEPLQWLQILALPASLFGIILIAHPALIIDVDHQPTPLSNHHLLHLKQLDNITAMIHNNDSNLLSTEHQQQLQQFLLHNHSTLDPHNLLTEIATTTTGTGTDAFGDWEQRWPGIVIALGVSLLISCTYIVLKFRRTTPIQTTTFWLGVCLIITSLCVMTAIGFGDIPDTTYEWSILFALGITSWLGQSCLQWAFLHEEAGILSIVRTLDVALTFAFSALLLDDEIYWTSIVGALIIGLVVVSIMLGNWIQKILCIGKGTAEAELATTKQSPDDNDEIGFGNDDDVDATYNINTKVRDKIPKQLISATTHAITKA